MTADDEWLWYGGRVSLDLVNTLRDRWTTPRETLHTSDDVAHWLHHSGLLVGRPRTGSTPASGLTSAVTLREAVDRAVQTTANDGLPAPADLTVINEAARQAPHTAPQLVISEGRLEPGTPARHAEDVTTALALVAQDAIELLLSPEIRHVRICGSERCALRFVDRSPGRNRRWCSMTRCGNRAKVRLHQARSRDLNR
ncbi:CGNR zinc finger domain-containing protein [Streptomyces sp. NPDC092369]|uniref:CGNR zinc finger domain-containing protein n=1 Tax=Streptomyces sp. NPDC092369 TaxID=3366015 RepID=UPI003806FEF5